MDKQLFKLAKKYLRTQLIDDYNRIIFYLKTHPAQSNAIRTFDNPIRQILSGSEPSLPLALPNPPKMDYSDYIALCDSEIAELHSNLAVHNNPDDDDVVIKAVTYHCIEETDAGICAVGKNGGKLYRHEWKKNNPHIHADSKEIQIRGKVDFKDNGVQDYKKNDNDYSAPPVPDRYLTVGEMVKIETDKGDYDVSNKILASNPNRNYLYIFAKFEKPESIDELQSIQNREGLSIIIFGTEGCPYCANAQNTIEKLTRNYPLFNYAYFNCSASEDTNNHCDSLKIEAVPLWMLWREGDELDRKDGDMRMDDVIEWLVNH